MTVPSTALKDYAPESLDGILSVLGLALCVGQLPLCVSQLVQLRLDLLRLGLGRNARLLLGLQLRLLLIKVLDGLKRRQLVHRRCIH